MAILKPNNELYYIQTDHLGTPRGVIKANDPTNTLVWKWDSLPFGETLPNEDPDGNEQTFTLNLRFPQYYDAESGLHYNGFRDYPETWASYAQEHELKAGERAVIIMDDLSNTSDQHGFRLMLAKFWL